MDHKYKSFELKAKEDETGMIAGFFSTYDEEPDSYGDIIRPGAFTETIKKREESGHPFPLCFNHDFSQVIGAVDKIEDTEKGPYIEAHFLDTALAQDVRKMLKSGAIYQFSFAYDVLGWEEPSEAQRKAGIWNILTKLEVFEISVVTVPANQNAVATEIKAKTVDGNEIAISSEVADKYLDFIKKIQNADISEFKGITADQIAQGTIEIKAGKRNSKADEEVITSTIDRLDKCINALKSLIDDEPEDNPTEEEAPAEAEPEVNEASEEPKDDSNVKRAEAILSQIKSMKEVPNHDD